MMDTVNRYTALINRYAGFGTALAIAISYTANRSVLWAIVHGLFSWFFVLYAAIVYP